MSVRVLCNQDSKYEEKRYGFKYQCNAQKKTVGSAMIGRARSHIVTIDHPLEKGGNDQGPTGSEFLLLGLGGCFLSTFMAALKMEANEIDVDKIEVQVTGTLAPMPQRFLEIVISVFAPLAIKELISEPLVKVERGYIVHNTIIDTTRISFEYIWLHL